MNIDDLLKLDNQLCFTVYACSREIIKLYRPHLEKLGLTYTQYITMLVLWEKHSISAKDLGDKLYLDSGTLTPLLKKLEGMGLIDRKRGTEDERSLIVSLTPKGMDLKDAAKEVPLKVACSVSLPLHEGIFLRETLKELTKKINALE
ncbi:MAG: MarR family transcriptional regulator [Clostridia bacterium]|nr:MarR family transcriptional regulator [Clostridia bacterium]